MNGAEPVVMRIAPASPEANIPQRSRPAHREYETHVQSPVERGIERLRQGEGCLVDLLWLCPLDAVDYHLAEDGPRENHPCQLAAF